MPATSERIASAVTCREAILSRSLAALMLEGGLPRQGLQLTGGASHANYPSRTATLPLLGHLTLFGLAAGIAMCPAVGIGVHLLLEKPRGRLVRRVVERPGAVQRVAI